MPGYMVGNITVTDPDLFAEYGKRVPETVAQFGGTYVVRGGAAEKIEGNYDPVRIVILQFEKRREGAGVVRLRRVCPAQGKCG